MRIAVTNLSTNVSNDEAFAMVRACQKQLTRDVSPAWNAYTAEIRYWPDADKAPVTWYPVVLMDDADQAGALGYHWETPDGRPYGRVFTKISAQYGSVSSVLSHEIIELYLDPDCNRYAVDMASNTLYAVEGCDAVEGDSYLIDNVLVSNFIYPAWFDRTHMAGSRFDHLRMLSGPFTMTPGGYLIYMAGGDEQQRFEFLLGEDVPTWKRDLKWFPAARTVRKLAPVRSGDRIPVYPAVAHETPQDGDLGDETE